MLLKFVFPFDRETYKIIFFEKSEHQIMNADYKYRHRIDYKMERWIYSGTVNNTARYVSTD